MLSLFVLWFVYLAVFDGQKAYYYILHFVPLYATLLAVFLSWLLLERKVNWAPVLLPVVLIVTVQLGGLAYRVRLNSYQNSYAPAVQYLHNKTGHSQLINANIAFLFGLNFPDNLVDDSHLAHLADFFVVDTEIAERLRNSRTGNPATYRHVTGLLENCYRKIYDLNSIQIYQLLGMPSATCQPGAGNNAGPNLR